jgi:biopolymer transport protein ExbD
MRYRRTHQSRASGIGFNATPLIDIIFTLTIFFMLVSRFSEAENVPMDLPRPDVSQAKTVKIPERVVINCLIGPVADDPARRVMYRLGPNAPTALGVLSGQLAALKRDSPAIQAVIRADRRLPYGDVRAVMRVVADQGIEMLNVVAHVGETVP